LLVAPKFNPNIPIDKARRDMESLTKFARLPSNTRVELVSLDTVSAEWVYRNSAPDDRVVLYLHGGGYNMCSPSTHRELAAHISNATNAKVLLLDYRLAPENPFPCALEDAIFAYRWLLGMGLNGGNIAIAGDSAGGGLSLAAAISLRDAGDPLPASIACISPWTDLEMTGDSIQINSEIDPMLNSPSLRIMANNYIGDYDPRFPLISPLYAELKGLSPILIHVGSDEILLDDSRHIAERARNAGINVKLKIYDRLWHVFHLNAKFMPEAKYAIQSFGGFIREHFTN
jgi:acetyl esterase/lipase